MRRRARGGAVLPCCAVARRHRCWLIRSTVSISVCVECAHGRIPTGWDIEGQAEALIEMNPVLRLLSFPDDSNRSNYVDYNLVSTGIGILGYCAHGAPHAIQTPPRHSRSCSHDPGPWGAWRLPGLQLVCARSWPGLSAPARLGGARRRGSALRRWRPTAGRSNSSQGSWV